MGYVVPPKVHKTRPSTTDLQGVANKEGMSVPNAMPMRDSLTFYDY